MRSAACAKSHGLRRMPRPTSTPATGVPRSRSRISPGSTQIAAAVHRDPHGFRHARDEVPVGQAVIRLRGGAAVHGHRRRARRFDHARQFGRIHLALVPAGAHLHGDGDLHRLHHRGNDAGGMLGLAHQAAAGVVLRNLRHRASHVDVDDVGAAGFDNLRGGGHVRGIAAEDLNGDRPLLFGELEILERAADAAHERLRRHHLRDHQAARAMPLHEAAERRVGHAGHGGDAHRGQRQGDGPGIGASAARTRGAPAVEGRGSLRVNPVSDWSRGSALGGCIRFCLLASGFSGYWLLTSAAVSIFRTSAASK